MNLKLGGALNQLDIQACILSSRPFSLFNLDCKSCIKFSIFLYEIKEKIKGYWDFSDHINFNFC